ncbi:MAG: YicC family protein [Bacteroidia bacterium]|nr:YicC family protein [Bacteroidia bacterium]
MIQSMTGFGKSVCEFQNKKIVAEIKSLNSKQMDISTRISGLYREKDIEIRSRIAQVLERGKVDFALYTDNTSAEANCHINTSVFEDYRKQIVALAAATGLEEPKDLFQLLLKIPDVMKTEVQDLNDEEWNAAQSAIDNAISQLIAFRKQEGEGLEKFFLSKITNIENLLAEVPNYERARVDKIKSRFEDNLKSLEDKITYDQNRVEQELIFYIEKLDISEEKQRLANHLKYFRDTLANGESQGKKLGFIAQEMGREINTLGSKANHSELQIIVVKMKDELEQIKEQVLNVL